MQHPSGHSNGLVYDEAQSYTTKKNLMDCSLGVHRFETGCSPKTAGFNALNFAFMEHLQLQVYNYNCLASCNKQTLAES